MDFPAVSRECPAKFTVGDLLAAFDLIRKAESPKRKKRKHVLFVAEDDSRLADKIKRSEKITNSELRRTLAAYRGEVQPDQEG